MSKSDALHSVNLNDVPSVEHKVEDGGVHARERVGEHRLGLAGAA
jgi:hypothetical protein